MTSDEISLHKFARHCRAFYDSSLILRPSSSSLSSTREEKKFEDNTNFRDVKAKKDDGRIVIEALDRIIAIRSLVLGSQQPHYHYSTKNDCNSKLQSSIASLRREHARIVSHASHSHTLKECGLLDIDRFVFSSSTENNPPIPHHDDPSSLLLIEQYTKLRDAVRRRAHHTAMLHRHNSLLDLLSQSSASATSNADHLITSSRMTKVNDMQHTLSIIQNFVNKYRSNIGSHSFLAGLHRLVELQLTQKKRNDPFYIIRWNFNGSVLTEACRSKYYGQRNLKDTRNEDDEDDLEYAHDAVAVLSSFLIRVNGDSDIESRGIGSIVSIVDDDNDAMELDGSTINEGLPEQTLSFEIDKGISNNNLKRILATLPDPKRLEARATGHVEVVDASSSVTNNGMACKQPLVPRKNVDGDEDEQWPWFSRIEFCIVL